MHSFFFQASITHMSESNGDATPQPIILPTDATALDSRMTLERTNERPNLKPSKELLDITYRRRLAMQDANKKRMEKYPLLPDTANQIYRIHGALAILEHSLYDTDGLMSMAENVSEATEDLGDQARTALYVGAAREMTGWVLGYADSAAVPSQDDTLWKERYQTEENYFHDLYDARKKIPNKKFIKYEGETIHMTLFLEYATSLKTKDREVYINREADERARYNLGIAESDISDPEPLANWTRREKAYIEDALEKHKASHGRKDFTMLY